MTNKVRVYGKAQNRTALGIMNAYLVMNPNATMDDFIQAFPKSLNPDNGWPVIFKKLEEITTDNEKGFFFVADDEVMHLQDGTNMVVCKMWTKPSFEKLVNHAAQYAVEIAEFEKGMKGEKGGFRLEYLNGFVPPVATPEPAPEPTPEPEPAPASEEPKKGKTWLWILIAVVILAALAAYFLMGSHGETEQPVANADTVVVHDTIYQEKIEELETKFNDAQFEQGKADLNDDAKFVLHDLATLLTKNPEVKLLIEGHTSAEGDSVANQKLSEDRAKATVDFLVSQGVDQARLTFKGYGSSKLKNKENPMAEENRRTEFIVEK